jgi:molybdopterin synthase catalytic subunit
MKKNGWITETPIDINELLAKSHSPKSGAVVLFSGEIRNANDGKEVSYIEYEAHKQLAEKVICNIVADAFGKWKLNYAVCVHRTGKVEISASAIVVITASSHRKEAYEANEYIVNRVKHEAPIWKKEYFSDGTYQWGNNCNCFENADGIESHKLNGYVG